MVELVVILRFALHDLIAREYHSVLNDAHVSNVSVLAVFEQHDRVVLFAVVRGSGRDIQIDMPFLDENAV